MKHRKLEIHDRILELVAIENGNQIRHDEPFSNTELDSLGLMFVLVELDTEYHILKDVPSGNEYTTLGLDHITLAELVDVCHKSLMANEVTS